MDGIDTQATTEKPMNPGAYFFSGDYTARLDVYDTAQVEGFAARLIEQGVAHDHVITPEHARVVANSIGPEFQVTVICGAVNSKRDVIKGMTTTTEIDLAEGHLLYLEDIVVMPTERRKGFAGQLIANNLLDAWNEGIFAGYAWETGRSNIAAHQLYKRIDPAFDADKLHDVWRFSDRKINRIANNRDIPSGHGHLADLNDLNAIAGTLHNQPDKNLGHISEILRRQHGHKTNGFNDPSFIVASTKSNSFAMISTGYSTFDGSRRSNGWIYGYSSPDDISDLIKGVSKEIVRRKWRGSVHLEFANNVISLNEERLRKEKDNVTKAEDVLKTLGGEKLIHDNNTMVGYRLTGERYVKAIIDAVTRNPNYPLRADRKEDLVREARRYGLGFGQAA
ncbi:MAG: GNAT family N-acetyltransferase [Bdellovibrionales bacterium]